LQLVELLSWLDRPTVADPFVHDELDELCGLEEELELPQQKSSGGQGNGSGSQVAEGFGNAIRLLSHTRLFVGWIAQVSFLRGPSHHPSHLTPPR